MRKSTHLVFFSPGSRVENVECANPRMCLESLSSPKEAFFLAHKRMFPTPGSYLQTRRSSWQGLPQGRGHPSPQGAVEGIRHSSPLRANQQPFRGPGTPIAPRLERGFHKGSIRVRGRVSQPPFSRTQPFGHRRLKSPRGSFRKGLVPWPRGGDSLANGIFGL